ncbi:alpha/beta hydrolase [Candidatus Hepatobacter penaei]|uniref:alpha/beta hydrolase n=1 Tax=Candidatus Hepatobacter penaei TaxID=1274402 RepID=UPI0004F313FD|nr:dienelactone hydrolase family protein [Candidatus Hepatobacter penaei]
MHLLNAHYRPPHTGKEPETLVVLFHGYGAHAGDLLFLAEVWSSLLPTTGFLSLDAPHALDDQRCGRYWFTLEDYDMPRIRQAIGDLGPSVRAALEPYMSPWGLAWSKVAFCGFSQGAAMALTLGLYDLPVGGVLGYAGVFVPPAGETPQPGVHVCMIHGDADDVVPIDLFYASEKKLTMLGVPFRGLVCPGVGHSLDTSGIQEGGDFLQAIL